MTPSDDPTLERRWLNLSALCDGQADEQEARHSFEAWRDDAELRQRWHAYQCIGDVMRSEDLAGAPGHDEAFLQRLRGRLAQEPVVLAPLAGQPQPAGVARAAGRRWGAPAAMAAGVMVVSGALLVLRSEAPPSEAAAVAAASGAATPALPVVAQATPPASVPAEAGPMLRNPELDRYLSAHRQYVASPGLAVPGAVRQVAVGPDGR